MSEAPQRISISNRKARHDYFIIEAFEAGIVLTGTEVKSLRQGNANLQDKLCWIEKRWGMVRRNAHQPVRAWQYLQPWTSTQTEAVAAEKQIRKLLGGLKEKGLTLVPLSVYFKGPYAKVELALARGKKSYDKREAIAKREIWSKPLHDLKRSRT